MNPDQLIYDKDILKLLIDIAKIEIDSETPLALR